MNTDYVQLDSRWNYVNVISPYHRIYYIDGGEGTIADPRTTLKLSLDIYTLYPATRCAILIAKAS